MLGGFGFVPPSIRVLLRVDYLIKILQNTVYFTLSDIIKMITVM